MKTQPKKLATYTEVKKEKQKLFPEKHKAFRETWMQNHPGWEFRLWTDADIEAFGLTNKRLYDETPNYGAKSDIARYEILYRIGGLYVDTKL